MNFDIIFREFDDTNYIRYTTITSAKMKQFGFKSSAVGYYDKWDIYFHQNIKRPDAYKDAMILGIYEYLVGHRELHGHYVVSGEVMVETPPETPGHRGEFRIRIDGKRSRIFVLNCISAKTWI